MEIRLKNKKDKVVFGDIHKGECFKTFGSNTVYLKVRHAITTEHSGVDLATGNAYPFNFDIEVVRINGYFQGQSTD